MAHQKTPLFVVELDDVFIHRLDLVRILAQPNDSGRSAFDGNRITHFESWHRYAVL
jgi:hypothetical protein